MDILLTGLSGLQSHQRAIEVTSHNIANATTPGYTRQQATLTTSSPEQTTLGNLGRGVTVEGVRRLANDLIIERLRQTQSESSRLSQIDQSLSTTELTFNEPGDNGLSASINQLFAGFENLSNNPESSALRNTVVQQIGAFTDTLNSIASSIATQRDDIANSLRGQVVEVNKLTSEIASLNQQIRQQVIANAAPNDLMDKRDTLIGQLSAKMDLTVRFDPTDGTARIDSNGRLLVGTAYQENLSVGQNSDGTVALVMSNGTAIDLKGGSIGALVDLHDNTLAKIITDLDSMAKSMAYELNARQSTGSSNATLVESYTSETVIDSTLTDVNLDSIDIIKPDTEDMGIPEAFMPTFTDSNGDEITRNLTINVYDTATKTAQKYVVRFDPATGSGGRTLDDLISAINSGRSTASGGFTLYPPNTGGITGVTARKISTDGGSKLQIQSTPGLTIDFSRSLDLAPADIAWASPATTVGGTDAALANKRVIMRVSGTNLQAWTRSPTTGSETMYAQAPLSSLSSVASAFGTGGLTVAIAAGTFNDGDQFGVDFNSSGAISTGTITQAKQWTAGDAAITVKGRYTGDLTYTPGQEWSMRVVTAGTVGSKLSPPLVEFTYYTGPIDAPVQQKLQKTLDDSLPAGSPITLTDGVYVTVGAGSLSASGNRASWIIDSKPDQAGLLPALGVNGLFKGSTAATLSLASDIEKTPSRIAVGWTRTSGDNSNLIDMTAVRTTKLFEGNTSNVDDFYQTLLANLGTQVAQTKRLQDTQESLATSIEGQRQQVSGVSIDEEVTFLIQQQQAYTAAARLITTARENVQTLLDLFR